MDLRSLKRHVQKCIFLRDISICEKLICDVAKVHLKYRIIEIFNLIKCQELQMVRILGTKNFFAVLILVFLVFVLSGAGSVGDELKKSPQEDFNTLAARINKETQQIMENVKRERISPALARAIEYAYPKQQPRYVLSLPNKMAVSKDDLLKVIRMPFCSGRVVSRSGQRYPESSGRCVYLYESGILYRVRKNVCGSYVSGKLVSRVCGGTVLYGLIL